MIRSSVTVLLAVAAMAVSPATQVPDLSGEWTLHAYRGSTNRSDGGASGSTATFGYRPAGGGGGSAVPVGRPGGRRTPAAQAVTVRQTNDALTIEEPEAAGGWRTVYQLDGTESVNVNGSVTLRTTSRWEDGRLVTEGTQTVSTGQADVTAMFLEVRTLTADGTMVIETTRTIEGRAPTTSRAEYRKGGTRSRR